MSKYKYPYIKGGKSMVAAVLGASNWISRGGGFNRAVSYYADKYGVDEDELAANIRARQAAGQRGKKSATAGRKFKWFIVCETVWSEANSETLYQDPLVLKGLTKDTVTNRFTDHDYYRTMRNDYGGVYAPSFDHVAIAEFDTRAEAEAALEHWKEYAEQLEAAKSEKAYQALMNSQKLYGGD